MPNIRVNKKKENELEKEKSVKAEQVGLIDKSIKKLNRLFNNKIKRGLLMFEKNTIVYTPERIACLRNLILLQTETYILADINDNQFEISKKQLETLIIYSTDIYQELEIKRLHCIQAIKMTETPLELKHIWNFDIFDNFK